MLVGTKVVIGNCCVAAIALGLPTGEGRRAGVVGQASPSLGWWGLVVRLGWFWIIEGKLISLQQV